MSIFMTGYKPDVLLQPFIETFWKATFNIEASHNFSHNIVPNGCIELIIHLTDHHCRLTKAGEAYDHSPAFTLMGVYEKPYVVKFPARVLTFGIRFHPDGFRKLLGVPPGKFLSTYEDGTSVVGKDLEAFCARIAEMHHVTQQVETANHFFSTQLMKHQHNDDFTYVAMQLIRQRRGLISVDELTNSIPISLRQLQRLFKLHYGLTITDYIRLSRLNTIRQYLGGNEVSLTQLAYELGFTDQSHFIREFKHYTGLSPGGFIRQINDFSRNAV